MSEGQNGVSIKRALGYINWAIGSRYLLLCVRLALGAMFILSADGKLPARFRFVNVISDQGIFPYDLAIAYGSVLQGLELVVGICLVIGLLSRLAAGTGLLMIIGIIAANGTWVYTLEYAFCVQDFVFVEFSDALKVDIGITAAALLILLYGGGFLSLDSFIRTKIKKQASSRSI